MSYQAKLKYVSCYNLVQKVCDFDLFPKKTDFKSQFFDKFYSLQYN